MNEEDHDDPQILARIATGGQPLFLPESMVPEQMKKKGKGNQ